MNIHDSLIDIICNISGNIVTKEINDNTLLTVDLGFDSLSLIELIVKIEDYFNIQIDDDDLDIGKIESFKYLLDTIEYNYKI